MDEKINQTLQTANIETVIKKEIVLEQIDMKYAMKGIIGRNGIIQLTANMRKDHRIFGFEEPSNKSRKMFLISIFTNEVAENPFNCPYGSYYETSTMNSEGIVLKYVSDTLDFRKIAIIKNNLIEDYAYIENAWLEFHSQIN